MKSAPRSPRKPRPRKRKGDRVRGEMTLRLLSSSPAACGMPGSQKPEHEQCNIVGLRGAAGEILHGGQDCGLQLFQRSARVLLDYTLQPFTSEPVAVRAHRVSDAIGEE